MDTATAVAPGAPADEDRIFPRLPVPGRYLTLVVLAFFAVEVWGADSRWVPWDETPGYGSSYETAGFVAILCWALAPGLTVWRPRVG